MNRVTQSERWSIEYKPAGAKRWTVVGTVGSKRMAEWFLLHLRGTGDWYVRPPRKVVARG